MSFSDMRLSLSSSQWPLRPFSLASPTLQQCHRPHFLSLVETLEAKHSSLWSSLNFSQQEKLLISLEQMKPEEQDCLLRVMMNQQWALDQILLVDLFYPSTRYEEGLLGLPTRQHSIDQSNLLRLLESLDPQEQTKLIRVMVRLNESQRVKLLSILNELEVLEQKILLSVLGTAYTYDTMVLKLMQSFLPADQSRLLRLLDGLDLINQHRLLKVLEHSSRRRELVERMDRLTREEQLELLRILDDVTSPERISNIVNQFEILQRKGGLGHWPTFEISVARSSLEDAIHVYCVEIPSVSYEHNIITMQDIQMMVTSLNKKSMKALTQKIRLWSKDEIPLQRLLLLILLMCFWSMFMSQGGFKNLLLDGRWLEFWEIILLAAGDVERNPGPTFMTEKELTAVTNAIIEEDDLSDIFDNVLPVSSKWSRFCSILGLRPSLLDTISKNHHGDCEQCLFEGVKHWLLGNYNTEKHGPPTWRKLVAAIDNSAGGSNHALAKAIAKKHSNKGTSAQMVQKPAGDDNDRDREESRGGHQHSAAFSKMYGAITRSIGRSLAVDDLRQFLRFFSHPHSPSQRYIHPSVYMGVESTRDILDQLYPAHVNPGNIYLLEEIVELSNSRQCKRLLTEYTTKYH